MTESEWLASEEPAAMLRTVRREHETGQSSVARVSDRKVRLFACACCRHPGVWSLLGPGYRNLVSAAEQAIEGLTADLDRDDWEDLQVVGWNQSDEVMPKVVQAALFRDITGNPWRRVTLPHDPACRVCGGTGRFHVGSGEDAEVFECRCCPWLTPTVKSLAHAAYDERVKKCSDCVAGERQWGTACVTCGGTGRVDDGLLDPVRLAVLADALEEAGCPQEEACRFCHGERVVRVPGCLPLKCDCVDRLPHPLLAHLRGPGPHVRGCFALDLILGKE